MRILLCSLSSGLGGVERRLEAECRLLVNGGHQVFVATPRFPGFREWQPQIEQAGGEWIDWQPYKFIERRHLAVPFQWLAMLSRRVLRARSIDFAHIALPWTYNGMSMASVLTSAGIPFVVSIHCKFAGSPLPDRGKGLVRDALRGLVGGYAVSAPALSSFMHHYTDLVAEGAQFQVIHNGIDTERFRPDAAARQTTRGALGLGDDQFTVILCGRLDPMKRPLMALRVFAGLLACAPRSCLLIVGDGPLVEAVRAEIRNAGMQRNVIVIGRVHDTAPYYAASDCYLSTSANMEGCPLAPAEALASGLPAIVPDDDVFGDVYGQCATVQRCDPADDGGWIAGLHANMLATDDLRRDWMRAGRSFVAGVLSLDIMKRRLAVFYEQVFGGLENVDQQDRLSRPSETA